MSATQLPSSVEGAQHALTEGDYENAIVLLEQALQDSPGSQVHALLALACYQMQNYASAAQHYQQALEDEPANEDWQRMLQLSQVNAEAELQEFVPEIVYFDKDSLLAPPRIAEGALPEPPDHAKELGFFAFLRLGLGNGIGIVSTVVLNLLVNLWGRFAGYRDEVWTNWYRRPLLFGILTLAYMRDQLNAHNLGTSYPEGALTGFQKDDLEPPPGVTHFRTADGSWNNLSDPKEGAAGTRFLRNVDLADVKRESKEKILTPNPREISRALFTREGPMKEIPFLNLLAATWIQFMNSDWINHGEIYFDDFIEVPLAEDDPARRRHQQQTMRIGRTQADPTWGVKKDEAAEVTSINEVTHWWDGSQIYGSDQRTQDLLRSGVDGKMRVNENGTLPLDQKGIEQTGFTRNWWLGQSVMHTLFVHEHNAICDRLKTAYPKWEDNRLFNVARLINAAVMAKIHTVEWTPAVLPNPGLDGALHANWYGLLTNYLRMASSRKTVADINVRNPELGGVVGNPINKHGQGFGLTEEFVEIYRLHSLLPETLALRRRGSDDVEQLAFVASRQAGSAKITARYSMSDLLYSFGNQHPGQLVLNNYPKFLQELSIPGFPFIDMGTVDLVRARERGVPRYNEFRRQLGLNSIRSFEDLTDDPEHLRKLEQLYGTSPDAVENLDLLVGTLAEGVRPTGFGFGETMFQVFILNATRRLQADRFYTDYYCEDVYTPEGMRWIDQADLKTVILRHHPELAATGLANVVNAFEPWDEPGARERLRPERHPLRAYNRELNKDPWAVEALRRN